MSADDRFAVIAPMRLTENDDTEQGIPVTSVIVEQSKHKMRPLTAQEELAATTVAFSKVNHIALERLQQPTVLVRDTDGASLTMHHDHSRQDEPTVLVSVQSNVPIAGKTSLAIPHLMSRPIASLRTALIQLVAGPRHTAVPQRSGRLPTGPVTLHRSDTGEQLPLDKTLLDMGFRFPPLLRVRGFYHELYLVCAEPLGIRMAVPWAPSMTVSDLLEHIQKRLAPRDLRHVRLRRRRESDGNETQHLDISRCFVPPPPRSVPTRETLYALKLCAAVDDPVCLTFLRPKDGRAWLYTVPFTGKWTMAEVAQFLITELCDAQDVSILDAYLSNPQPLLAAASGGTVLPPRSPFDDEDEEVLFESADGIAGSSASSGDALRGMFMWTHAEIQDVYGAHTAAACGGSIISFCPPPSAAQGSRPPQRFIPIDEDFSIPHLSDVGILPGDEVLVEFFDPMSGRWSGELSNAVTRLLPAAWDADAHTLHPNHELLTIRSLSHGAMVRIPCTPTTTVESVLWMYFMATGSLPMFGELVADNGNALAPFQSIAGANLLPQTTLFHMHRRRQWLREVIPDLNSIDVLCNSRMFAGAPMPAL
jgi:hypothetical protein